MLTLVGVQVGRNWETWHKRLEFLDYGIAALIVAAVVYLIVRSRRRRGAATEAA
jgi:membrane protein DedA with SNARE-associated domain